MEIESLLYDKKFKKMQKNHCYEILKHLIQKRINFSIICNISCVKFEPELPREIRESFSELTVFILAGYTFESLEIDENNLYFEAGFGEENLGSFVTTPLESIVQIFLSRDGDIRPDSCVYINLLANFAQNAARMDEDEGVNISMKSLLSNPENHRFRK